MSAEIPEELPDEVESQLQIMAAERGCDRESEYVGCPECSSYNECVIKSYDLAQIKMLEQDKEGFYIQDTRSVAGNCMVWWAEDCTGYVCDIRKAHVFTKEEAYKRMTARSTDRPWPKDYIDARVSHHIDAQSCLWEKALRDIIWIEKGC